MATASCCAQFGENELHTSYVGNWSGTKNMGFSFFYIFGIICFSLFLRKNVRDRIEQRTSKPGGVPALYETYSLVIYHWIHFRVQRVIVCLGTTVGSKMK